MSVIRIYTLVLQYVLRKRRMCIHASKLYRFIRDVCHILNTLCVLSERDGFDFEARAPSLFSRLRELNVKSNLEKLRLKTNKPANQNENSVREC